MKSNKINVDKILKEIKANNRRIKQGMPLKFIVAGYAPRKKSKITKKVVLDAFMYTIACASISLMLVILLIQWMSI